MSLFDRRVRIGVALMVPLLAACAPVCPNGATPRVVPCHTVVRHSVVGLQLSVDRAVAGWSVRSGDRVMPLDTKGMSVPISEPPEAAVLEGPEGQRLPIPGAIVSDRETSERIDLPMSGSPPAKVSVVWIIATDVSECHGAPPTTTCESTS